MHITWHGMSCIKIQSDEVQVLINPYQDSVGLTMPKLKVDIAATTNINSEESNNFQRLQGDPLLITNPGEYEAQGVFFYGIPHNGGAGTMFVIEAEGLKLGHPGTSPDALTEQELEQLEGVDVLFLPLTCSEKKTCATIVSQVEPRVIIPIQYKTAKVKAKLETIDAFAKEMGLKDTTGEKKVIIKQKDLPVEETQVIVLQPV